MKLKQCLCVFLSLLFAVSLAGCREKTDPIYEQTIQYNLESEPSSLDPQIADDQSAQIVIMSLFEGLTRIGPDGEAQPGVAERWEHNGDYTAFTFYLREDACWTDEDETPGGGHLRASSALKSYILETQEDCEVEIVDTLKYISPLLDKTVTEGYEAMAKRTPKLFGSLYKSTNRGKSKTTYFFCNIFRKYLMPLVEEFRPAEK